MRKFLSRLHVIAIAFIIVAGTSYVPALSQTDNPVSDSKVRQAIAYAIDMDTIVDTLFEGKAIVADSMIPNGAWKAPGLNQYSYDPDRARALLKEAGWKDGTVLDVVFYYGDQLTVDLMSAIQAYLKDVGIGMTFGKLEGDVSGQLNVVSAAGSDTSAVDWHMAYGARAALALHEYYNIYDQPKSPYAFSTPERQSLIKRINATADIDIQKVAFADFQRYENEMLSDIPLYYQQLFVVESNRVNRNGGQYGNAQFNYDWGIVNWTVTPDENGKAVLYAGSGPVQFFAQPWLNPGLTMSSKVVFDRLLTADGSLVPGAGQLAESVELSNEGMTVRFTLKEGLTWHDGAPVTAEDVSWSVHTAIKVTAVNSVISNTFRSLAGADAYIDGSADSISGISVDGNSITFDFATLDPNVLITFSQFPPLPKHLLDGVDPTQFQQHSFWQFPIGSGPFKLAEVEMNDYARFVPFDNYHGGIAKIDEIVAIPQSETGGDAVKNAAAGLLDYSFTKSVPDVKALEAMDHMRVIPVNIPYTRSFRVNGFPKKPS